MLVGIQKKNDNEKPTSKRAQLTFLLSTRLQYGRGSEKRVGAECEYQTHIKNIAFSNDPQNDNEKPTSERR